ncbi:hypothetical protein D3C81_387430 [compost metagenome]
MDLQLQRLCIAEPGQAAVDIQRALARIGLCGDLGRPIGLGDETALALVEGQAQRRELALEVAQLCITAQRRLAARATQAHVAFDQAGRAHHVRREQFQPVQARHVEVELAVERCTRLPTGLHLRIDEAVALEAHAQVALDAGRGHVQLQRELVITHQLATVGIADAGVAVLAEAYTTFGRAHFHVPFPRVATRTDLRVQVEFATQVDAPAGLRWQPRLHQRQRQRIAAHHQAFARPVGVRAQGAAGRSAQAGFAQRVGAAVDGECRGRTQCPRIALHRCDAQRGQFATPLLALLAHAALQFDRAQFVACLCGQAQVGDTALRIDVQAFQQHAGVDLLALNRQRATVATPRQAALDAQAFSAVTVPVEIVADQIGGDVRRIARAFHLHLATQATIGAGQQIAQLQRLEARVDVQAVADLARGGHPAAADGQFQFTLALFTLQGELALGIHIALAQDALQRRQVHRGLQRARGARRRIDRRRQLAALGCEIAGQTTIPTRREVARVEILQRGLGIPVQLRCPGHLAFHLQLATRGLRLQFADLSGLIVATHIEAQLRLLLFALDIGTADRRPRLQRAGQTEACFLQCHRHR